MAIWGAMDCFTSFAMTGVCHCEERSDVAIWGPWIASLRSQ